MRIARTLLLACFGFALLDGSAEAFTAGVARDHARLVQKVRPMPEGRFRLAPLSFVRFCMENPSECEGADGAKSVDLTDDKLAELVTVNRAVNSEIRPEADTTPDRRWKLGVSSGDCNAYAIAKRHALIERGWPARALSLAVVMTPQGEGHLVLTVRTDRGDMVLDNLRSDIIAWHRTGYDWVMRQSADRPLFWVEVRGNADV